MTVKTHVPRQYDGAAEQIRVEDELEDGGEMQFCLLLTITSN